MCVLAVVFVLVLTFVSILSLVLVFAFLFIFVPVLVPVLVLVLVFAFVFVFVFVRVEYMSSDLEVLVGDLIKADIACIFRGSRKFRDDMREREVQVSRKFYVTHVVKISVFRKTRIESRDSSAIVTTKEMHPTQALPMSWKQRVVSKILDILKLCKKMSRKRCSESFAKGKVTFRETSVSRCKNLD